jgi:protein-disulfide isomerase
LFCLGCSAQSLSPEINQRIERQIRAQFKVPSAMTVTLGPRKPSPFSGFDVLPVTIDSGSHKQTLDFLLSKDGQTLYRLSKVDISPEAYAHTLAQEAENRRAQAELMKKIDVAGRPWRGAANPKVSIVVYDDFECPYCGRMYQDLFASDMKSYQDRVRIVFKDFPLFEIHPWARRAAIDSNCLAEQSNEAYWMFSDYVHASQKDISARDVNTAHAKLDNAALEAGRTGKVNLEALQACLKAQPDAALKASVKEAENLGVASTPTLFINGEKVEGALPSEQLRKALDTALQDAAAPTVASSSPVDTNPAHSK